jgi:hypothetical protein
LGASGEDDIALPGADPRDSAHGRWQTGIAPSPSVFTDDSHDDDDAVGYFYATVEVDVVAVTNR